LRRGLYFVYLFSYEFKYGFSFHHVRVVRALRLLVSQLLFRIA
jgi:hypothetical protein